MDKLKVYKITDHPRDGIDDITIVEPVWANSIDAQTYYKCMRLAYVSRGKIYTPGEIGCALAHLKAWQMISHSEQSGLIFEDDISITAESIEIARRKCTESDKGFIHLGIHPQQEKGVYFLGKKMNRFPDPDLYEVCPHTNLRGAFAYYLSPECARKLVGFHENNFALSDSWGHVLPRIAERAYHIPLFKHPMERGELQKERNEKPTLGVRRLAELRAKSRLKRHVRRWKAMVGGFSEIR